MKLTCALRPATGEGKPKPAAASGLRAGSERSEADLLTWEGVMRKGLPLSLRACRCRADLVMISGPISVSDRPRRFCLFGWLPEVVQVSIGAIAHAGLLDAFSFFVAPSRSARCEMALRNTKLAKTLTICMPSELAGRGSRHNLSECGSPWAH